MALVLLLYLLCQVHCEWVEIAQNSYRRNTPVKDSGNVELTTQSHKKYTNITLRVPDWHRGLVNRVNNVGNVRRIPYETGQTPTPKIYTDEPTYPPKYETDFTETVSMSNKQEFYDIDINRNINNPNKNTKIYSENTKLNRHDNLNGLTIDVFDDEQAHLDQNERIYITAKPGIVKGQTGAGHSHKENSFSITEEKNNFKYFNANFSPPVHVHVSTLYTNKGKDKSRHQSQEAVKTKYELKSYPNEPNKTLIMTSSIENDLNVNPLVKQDNKKNKENLTILPNLNKKYANILNKPDKETPNTSISDVNIILKHLEQDENTLTKPEALEDSFDSQNPDVSKIKMEESEKADFRGIWSMLSFIKDIIAKNTQKSVKSKIKYLEDLKHNILYSIEEHINRAWPDDPSQGQEHSRAARSAHARGHVELPSSEGALMTISFLTFAVFLIKLVLQIIHTYKNKTMMMTPAVVTAVGRAAASLRTRN